MSSLLHRGIKVTVTQPLSEQRTMMPKKHTQVRGLANIGNTCYLNSALQALRHNRLFQELFGEDDSWRRYEHPDRRGHELTDAFSQLMKGFAEEKPTPIGPYSFVKAFIRVGQEFNDEIRFGAQADAAEAVQIILDSIHTYLSREVRMDITGVARSEEANELVAAHKSWAGFFCKEYSPLLDQFYGQTQTTVTCDECKTKSTRYEPWCVLKAPIPGADKVGAPAPTLQDCIAASFEADTIDDYSCEVCKKRGPARITHALSKFPECIVLSLKRFTNAGAKVRARIPYDPDAVSFAACKAWGTIPAGTEYRVVSTIEHMGSSRGGHYIMRQRKEDNDWLVIDDANIYPAPSGGAAGPDTYILFLERKATK
jgi:ubiquitin C-terminal hydrolase